MCKPVGTTKLVKLVLLLAIGMLGSGCGPAQQTLDESGNYVAEAQEAIAAGDSAKAIDLLTKSIAAKPYPFAYFQRAQLYVEGGKDAEAIADCEAGLQISPEHSDLKWLLGELKKPKETRFKGKFAKPPQAAK